MVRVLIGGVLVLVISMGVGRFAFTPILPAMQAATGLGTDAAGLLASLNYLGYFLGALGVGLVPQGAARTAVFRTALIASVTSTAGMGFTEGMAAWAVLRFVSGLASAGLFILGIAMTLDALARAGRESWTGWLYTGVGLGIASSGLFVAVMGDRLGWRGDWLWLGLACLGFGTLSWLWVSDAPRAPGHMAAARPTPAPSLRPSAPMVLLTLAYFLEGAGYIVTGTFLVAILKTMPETAPLGAAAWMVTGLAAMPSGIVWAAAGRRLGLWRALILAHVVQTVGILLPITGSPAAALLSAVLFGGTFVGIVTLSFTLGRHLSGGASARVIGALTAVYGLGQIIGPVPAGLVVARTGSFDSALLGAAAAVLAGALLLAAGAWMAGRRDPAAVALGAGRG
ncbi:MFS transporter [Azospirillum baldaniorum]|uniref:Permease of the major facilitator superfamily MSF-1 n=2 Tax=Azospirillum baldaniorum TaxID=1064539 RepID=A0A9P1NK91_9PROT|nr:YbfB/YjiJ family MFS transporter [Azospirillum baldaniorum]AWJ88622.1 MFS transporter [Azospirillum baldaniorum]TWA79847.1 putative MFS family arabinose efflux permease [Azospirillum brasilense]CCC96420.1 putative permease of the major facilitator superfamily MSF-1 [Azospirillum baldaniorum]